MNPLRTGSPFWARIALWTLHPCRSLVASLALAVWTLETPGAYRTLNALRACRTDIAGFALLALDSLRALKTTKTLLSTRTWVALRSAVSWDSAIALVALETDRTHGTFWSCVALLASSEWRDCSHKKFLGRSGGATRTLQYAPPLATTPARRPPSGADR